MCAFRMGVSKEAVEGRENINPGIYEVRLVSFGPKFSKPQEGREQTLNLNPKMEIINNPDVVNRFVFDTLNQNAFYQADFVHCFGVEMEQEGDTYYLPGTWDSDPAFDPAKAETYKYRGPLLGKVGKVEIAIDVYQGKSNNKIRRFFCAVEDCATKFPQIKHSTDLMRKA